MNIRQYYEQCATASLHAALAAFIPAIGLLFYIVFFSQMKALIVLMTPFLIYSFFCYQKYLLNHRRANSVQFHSNDVHTAENGLFINTEFLITFLPAPSLRLLLFHSDGVKVGELRDTSTMFLKWFVPKFFDRFIVKMYGLYDKDDQPLAYFSFHHEEVKIYITEKNSELEKELNNKGVRNKNLVQFEQRSYWIEANGIQDLSIILKSSKSKVGQIQTGWMPLEWSERFIDANTPIFRLQKTLSKEERLQLFSLLISIYAYHNH